MPDLEEFFEQAIAEHGLDAQVFRDEKWDNRDKFYISKQVGENKLSYYVEINTHINTTTDQIKKEIVLKSRDIAKEFEKKLTEQYINNTGSVTVSKYDGGWARCDRCKTTVEFPNMYPSFGLDAELSTPQPFPQDVESRLNKLDGHPLVLMKLYLMGKLRRNCDHDCPNHWATERLI